MKKRFIILITVLALVLASASSVFASGLTFVQMKTPKENSTNSQTDNIAIKLEFDQAMAGATDPQANAGKIKVTDEAGNSKKFELVCSDKHPNEVWLILDNEDPLEQKTTYTVTVAEGVAAANGSTTSESKSVQFTTRNSARDGIISTVMMFGMIGILVFMTSRATKKQQEETRVLSVAQAEKLNPYKIAKQKKISMKEAEEYVRKEREKARKAEEKIIEERRRRAAISEAERKAIEAEVDSEERRNGWFRVHSVSSLSAHNIECPKAIKRRNAAKRKAAEERAKKFAKNKKKK